MRPKNALKIAVSSFLFLFLSPIFFAQNVSAEETLPTIYLNDLTGQCVHLYKGTECLNCDFSTPLGEGWNKNDDLTSCPNSFTRVKRAHECTVKKTPACCTINEAGIGGDCDDVVIKGTDRKCAFVEDITMCETLPDGWEKASEDEDWGVICPSEDFEWEDGEINCNGKRVDVGDDIVTDADVNVLFLEEDNENEKIIAVAGAFLLMGFLVWWFYFRKRMNN